MMTDKTEQEQILRIEKAEAQLDRAVRVLGELERALENYIASKADIAELIEYYDSPEWLCDYDDSNEGKLPNGLKCGVLSQDAVFDMLSDRERLFGIMRELAGEDK